MKVLVYVVVGIIIGLVFSYLNAKIRARVSNVVKEKFDWKKFKSGFLTVRDPVLWVKDFYHFFNVRKLLVYLIILGVFYGVGYYKAIQQKPVYFDVSYGKEIEIKLDGHYLHIYKNGEVWVEENGEKIKRITVKDIPELKKKLSPFGIDIKPIAIIGGGIGDNKFEGEGGAGLQLLRYWKGRLDTFLTNKGIYLGLSYKLDFKNLLNNSAVGVGIGKGYSGDDRVIIYWRFNF